MNKTAANSENKAVSFPFLSLFFGPYSLIFDRIKYFFLLGAVFTTILSVLFIAGGQTALCYNQAYSADHFCSTNLIVSVGIRLVAFFIICVFLRIWYQTALQNAPVDWKLLKPQMADLKIAGGFAVYFISLLIALTSFYLLLQRVPNPDWRIELAYFTVVSLGFFAPLLALRFVVYFAFWAANEKLPGLGTVWQKTSNRGFMLFGGIVLLLLIAMFLLQSLMASLSQFDGNISLFTIIGSEYISNIAAVFIAASFINYCYLQKIFLFERTENEK